MYRVDERDRARDTKRAHHAGASFGARRNLLICYMEPCAHGNRASSARGFEVIYFARARAARRARFSTILIAFSAGSDALSALFFEAPGREHRPMRRAPLIAWL